MHSDRIDASNQEITRAQNEHAEILKVLKRREQATAHPYGPIAGTLGAAALVVWGSILRDARVDPLTIANRAYLAWLAFAIVLGIAASAATVLWASVRNTRRLAAEQDRIKKYDDEQKAKRDDRQTEKIVKMVLAGLRDEERKKYIKAVADEFRAETATLGRVDEATVVPFGRPRHGQRSS